MKHCMLILFSFFLAGGVFAQEAANVSAELKKDEAWTGEGVPMVIKLRSPGPFSGTAAFDLPEVSKTAFLKVGNPVVGNEEVDGKSYFTQIHQFSIYSQQNGKVVIPSFLIRFSGKKDFTGEAEPMEGNTPELSFVCKRPEGTEGIGVVVTVKDLKVSQSWRPSEGREVDAGDILRRTITRSAGDTTAMIFPPVDDSAPDGVKVYGEDPVVEDKTERGVISAKREETLRYQFVRAGTYTLPELTISWWDPEANELKQEVLPGETVTVRMSESAVASVEEEGEVWPWLLGAAVIGVAFWLRRKEISARYHQWQEWRCRPEAVASKELLDACRDGEAKAAYLAAMAWQRAVGVSLEEINNRDYHGEISALSEMLYGKAGASTQWSGHRLADSFRTVRREWNRGRGPKKSTDVLPALNAPKA